MKGTRALTIIWILRAPNGRFANGQLWLAIDSFFRTEFLRFSVDFLDPSVATFRREDGRRRSAKWDLLARWVWERYPPRCGRSDRSRNRLLRGRWSRFPLRVSEITLRVVQPLPVLICPQILLPSFSYWPLYYHPHYYGDDEVSLITDPEFKTTAAHQN